MHDDSLRRRILRCPLELASPCRRANDAGRGQRAGEEVRRESEGADVSLVLVDLASSPDVAGVSGRYFEPRGREAPSSRRSYDAEARARLGRASVEMTGVG